MNIIPNFTMIRIRFDLNFSFRDYLFCECMHVRDDVFVFSAFRSDVPEPINTKPRVYYAIKQKFGKPLKQ